MEEGRCRVKGAGGRDALFTSRHATQLLVHDGRRNVSFTSKLQRGFGWFPGLGRCTFVRRRFLGLALPKKRPDAQIQPLISTNRGVFVGRIKSSPHQKHRPLSPPLHPKG